MPKELAFTLVTGHILIFLYNTKFQAHLVNSLLETWISHFIMQSLFSLVGNGTQKQDLGIECTHCYWSTLLLGYIHAHTHILIRYLNSYSEPQNSSSPSGSSYFISLFLQGILIQDPISIFTHLISPIKHLR